MLLSVAALCICGAAWADNAPDASGGQANTNTAMDDAHRATVKNWYVGFGVGFGELRGWDRGVVDNYYSSAGYSPDTAPGWLNFGSDIYQYFWKELLLDGNVYVGYRLLSFMDVELGYSRDDGRVKNGYKNNVTNVEVWSDRQFTLTSKYAAVLFRPPTDDAAHGLFLKFGRQESRLDISKTVTGAAPNLAALAAGDQAPGDGVSHGTGRLVGVGYDFRMRDGGAIRLQWSEFVNVGGPSFNKVALTLGYLASF